MGNTVGYPGRLVVVSERPLLDCAWADVGVPTLLLYAKPGWDCAIEERGELDPGAAWRETTRLRTAALTTTLPLAATNQRAFYRAVKLQP
jgi:hypothetical protein